MITYKRKGKAVTGVAIIGLVLVVAIFATLGSFVTMYALGRLHQEIPAVPALSFWGSFWLLGLISIIGNAFHSDVSKGD